MNVPIWPYVMRQHNVPIEKNIIITVSPLTRLHVTADVLTVSFE